MLIQSNIQNSLDIPCEHCGCDNKTDTNTYNKKETVKNFGIHNEGLENMIYTGQLKVRL